MISNNSYTLFICLLVVLAVAPGIFFIVYLYKRDKIEKEPIGLLALMLLAGLLATASSYILELLAEYVLGVIFYYPTQLYIIIDAFIGVALVEEGTKYFFMKKFSWKNKAFDYVFDGVIYATFTSLGFAISENVLYSLNYGLDTTLLRAVTAIPGHTAFGVLMGIFYGEAKKAEALGDYFSRNINNFLALASATIAHGLYDYCLMQGSDLMYSLWFGVIIAVYIVVFVVVILRSKKDEKIIKFHELNSYRDRF